MENFPGINKLPHSLSPFIDDSSADRREGCHLGLTRPLVSLFASEEAEKAALSQSEFLVPPYYLRSVIMGESELKLKPQHVKQFSLDTLMYCFYNLPNDVMQSVAAQELSVRDWKYHTGKAQWFRSIGPKDNVSVPILPSNQKAFMTFDVSCWEEQVWTSSLDANQFLSDYSLSSKVPALNGSLRTSPL